LGPDRIYVQAKRRTEGSVGRADIQAFVGALDGKSANKGVFITASRFSPEAQEWADRIARSDDEDPYVFRLDLSEVGMSTVRVVFGRDVASDRAAIHADLGGQPVSLIRRPTKGRRVRRSRRR
jgi:Restriction endonuclease